MNKLDVSILAVPAQSIPQILEQALKSQQVIPFPPELDYSQLISLGQFGRRGDLEVDPSRKQLITYLVIRNPEGKIFYYWRNGGTTESRLHGKLSIGVGGHVEDTDLLDAVIAEAREEVGMDLDPNSIVPVGLIYSENTPVDQVHLGVLLTAVATGIPVPDEREIVKWGFAGRAELQRLMDENEVETWSRMGFEFLEA